jgi:hypothetical protein
MRYRQHVHPILRRPGKLLLRNWLAITLGGHIWSWRPLDAAELAHEVVHVEQWARHGWRYPLRYWWASVTAMRSRRSWYWDNEFERAARAAADKVRASLREEVVGSAGRDRSSTR